jgi:nicotinamide riboside transporter PnuC
MSTITVTGTILVTLKYKESMTFFTVVNVAYVIYTILMISGLHDSGSATELIPLLIMYVGFLTSSAYAMHK